MTDATDAVGNSRLFLGDCREVLPMLQRPDAVVTDPPYGIGINPATRRPSNYQRKKGMSPRMWDMEAPDLSHVIGTSAPVVIWGGNYFVLPPSRGWMTWYKPDAPPSMSNVELAWTNRDANIRQFSYTVAATNSERIGHPTQKPIAVMRWCIQQLKLGAGATVLDPYMGSGTTGVAAISLGLNFVGIEIDKEYYEIAKRRLTHATGEGPGQLFSANLFNEATS